LSHDDDRRANHPGSVKPPIKKYSDFQKWQISLYAPPSRLTPRGASRTSRTRDGMRWTRQRRARKGLQGGFSVSDRPACGRTALPTVFDETGRMVRGPARASAGQARTVKSCGPDAPMLASSRVEMCPAQPGLRYIANPQGDGGKKAGHRGDHVISRKPLRGESRDDPVEPVVYSCAFCAHDRGCNRRPAFPAPSILEEGQICARLGRTAPRECGRMFCRRFPGKRHSLLASVGRNRSAPASLSDTVMPGSIPLPAMRSFNRFPGFLLNCTRSAMPALRR
jgi:hypothetical protein